METKQLKYNFIIDIDRAREIDRLSDLKEKWYGLNGTDNVGCCTYLYKKYGYPETYEDFYNSYITDNVNLIQNETNIGRSIGRNEHYLYKIAKVLAKKDNYRFTMEEYYSYIIKKLIVDTLDGSKMEAKVNEMLLAKGYRTESPSLVEDTKYGIDLKVIKDNKLICMIQVKPHTFFIGNNNQSLIKDRIKALVKEQNVKNLYHVPTAYIIYNKNTKEFIRTNGKLTHRLSQLINEDGTTKNLINKY